eukprot:835176_1
MGMLQPDSFYHGYPGHRPRSNDIHCARHTRHYLVDLKACKTVPQSKDAYRKVARNRLNRHKPKFIGNFVFAPLLFHRLYQFCRRMFAENGVIAFVSVLSDVLCPPSVIRFEQTRAQPLVPYNTLAMDNAFRSSGLMLLKHYDLVKDWG